MQQECLNHSLCKNHVGFQRNLVCCCRATGSRDNAYAWKLRVPPEKMASAADSQASCEHSPTFFCPPCPPPPPPPKFSQPDHPTRGSGRNSFGSFCPCGLTSASKAGVQGPEQRVGPSHLNPPDARTAAAAGNGLHQGAYHDLRMRRRAKATILRASTRTPLEWNSRNAIAAAPAGCIILAAVRMSCPNPSEES